MKIFAGFGLQAAPGAAVRIDSMHRAMRLALPSNYRATYSDNDFRALLNARGVRVRGRAYIDVAVET